MKKFIVMIIMSLFVTGCSNDINIFENINKSVSINYSVSSNSVSFSSNGEKYELYKEDELIDSGNVDDKNTIDNLESDTTYKLVIDEKEEIIKTDKITTIRFGGDVMMTSYFKNYIDSKGVDYMWEDVSDLIKTADYSVFNLETSVSLRGSDTKPKGYGFRSEPFTLEGLKNAGIDMVTIANNHVMDYGRDAFSDTLNSLDEYEIEYIGAGKNKSEANKINYQEVNGIKVGFLGASEILGYNSNKATDEKSGVFYLNRNDLSDIKSIISAAQSNCDVIVLVLHWDREYYDSPKEETIKMAHELIDSGADIIIGHHPHVLQGIEYYKNGIIYYSTGNFNFLIRNENASQSALFELNLDKEKIISSKVYPIKINACKANLLDSSSDTYKTIINNLNERSKKFGTKILEDGCVIKS